MVQTFAKYRKLIRICMTLTNEKFMFIQQISIEENDMTNSSKSNRKCLKREKNV